MKTGLQNDFAKIFAEHKGEGNNTEPIAPEIIDAPKEGEDKIEPKKEETPHIEEPKPKDAPKDTPKEVAKAEEETKQEAFEKNLSKVREGSRDIVDFVKDQISSGEWEDFEVEVEEGQFVKLSEMDSLSKEELSQVYEEQKKIRLEEYDKNYINVSDASESRRILAEILLKGSDEDIRKIKENPELAYEPYSKEQGWDLDDANHRYTIYIRELQKENNLSEKKAIALANIAFEEGDLDQAVDAMVEKRRQDYTEKLQARKDEILEEQKESEVKTTEFKKELSAIYKKQGMKDPEIKKLVTLATNNEINDIFDKAKNDPETASELILFLTDKEAYLNKFEFKAKAKTNAENMITLRRVSETQRSSSGKTITKDNAGTGFRFDMSRIKPNK